MKIMEFSHVTSVFLITMAMTVTISCALPYQSWFDPETAALERDERYPPTSDFGPVLDRLRQFMALKLMKQEMSRGDLDKENDNDKETSRAKRLDFGFAGLDNMDHILSTLDRKEAMRSLPSPRLLQNMQRHGYQGVSMAKLTQMMKNAG